MLIVPKIVARESAIETKVAVDDIVASTTTTRTIFNN